MELFMSKRFQHAYESSSLGLKDKAEGAIHDFVNLYRSDRRTFLQRRPRLAQEALSDVIELDLTSGHRMLVYYAADRLTMLHMGDHDITARYTKGMRDHDLRGPVAAPRFFMPEHAGFFTREPELSASRHYDEETSSEWIYYLEDQQEKVNKKIINRLIKMVDRGEEPPPPYLVLGGPGTGKTCILLNILRIFGDLDDDFRVGIVISTQLAEYVEESVNANISRYRIGLWNTYSERYDLLLVDDPGRAEDITFALEAYRQGRVRALVLSFDPLQLSEALSDDEFQTLVDSYGAQTYRLDQCYRQKERVGRRTKHVVDIVAASTPFLHRPKIEAYRQKYRQLTQLSNEMTFVNPKGHVEYYVEATVEDIRKEVNRILEQEWLMWRHYPGLLVVEGMSDGLVLSEASHEALWPLKQRNFMRLVKLDDIVSVKGLEFQHVFIFLSLGQFNEIQQGFSGSGRRVYNQRRLLRIPFSRAKDSLVTFALAKP